MKNFIWLNQKTINGIKCVHFDEESVVAIKFIKGQELDEEPDIDIFLHSGDSIIITKRSYPESYSDFKDWAYALLFKCPTDWLECLNCKLETEELFELIGFGDLFVRKNIISNLTYETDSIASNSALSIYTNSMWDFVISEVTTETANAWVNAWQTRGDQDIKTTIFNSIKQ